MDSSNKKNSEAAKLIARRSFLIGTGAAAAGLACWYIQKSGQVRAEGLPASPAKMVTIVEFSDSGERKGKVSVEFITKTEEEWKKQLSPASFEVTRQAGTERAYTNENPNNHAKGVFRCICCDTALFEHQIRIRYRLAEFLGAHRERERCGDHGHEFGHDSNGGFLPVMRCASWACLR